MIKFLMIMSLLTIHSYQAFAGPGCDGATKVKGVEVKTLISSVPDKYRKSNTKFDINNLLSVKDVEVTEFCDGVLSVDIDIKLSANSYLEFFNTRSLNLLKQGLKMESVTFAANVQDSNLKYANNIKATFNSEEEMLNIKFYFQLIEVDESVKSQIDLEKGVVFIVPTRPLQLSRSDMFVDGLPSFSFELINKP